MTHLDPCTSQCELEVQRIIHLQNFASQLPDAFIDTKKVTKSHILAANTPTRIDVLVEKTQIIQKAPEKAHIEQEAPEKAHIERETLKETQIPENCEISIEHFPNGVLVHQSTYIKKVLKCFYMDKVHPLSSPIVVRSLDMKKDSFRSCEKNEELLGPKIPYLSGIGALMYLANCTRLDIAFSVNLLAKYSSAPTRRHWNGVKHILRYFRGTIDMSLFYSRESKQQLLGYADAGYLSDSHKGKSQIGYVFNCDGTAISWRSVKQTMVVTSSNHLEILAIHKASRESIWLRSMIQHLRESYGLSFIKGDPTILFEDNVACIAQIIGGYIKEDRTKHISPKFFYIHEL
uniref:Retrovirus-related Pol polyprotein from transposon TNT 1-94 n=1 Tax=Vitis vinifera TaxID=29760 RepID=A5AGT4_VITVI|nr:hypothetical protein VITISV_040724 [Vitis vinifera]